MKSKLRPEYKLTKPRVFETRTGTQVHEDKRKKSNKREDKKLMRDEG